jgi:hypothetical protein
MQLDQVIRDVADALVAIDQSRVPFREFRPGVGPYGEPQLVRAIAQRLNEFGTYRGTICTKRCPDLLIRGAWAVEFKLVRPFGDNGKEAENWSVNLLHPYEGSAIGDCLKLEGLDGAERKAVLVIGYEHTPPRISLAPLFAAFEVVARDVMGSSLSQRAQVTQLGLVHPVHQQLLVAGSEVLKRAV